jgi:hypothetical protein
MTTRARKRYIQLRTTGENPYKAAQIVGITTDDARGRYERAYQESLHGNTSESGPQAGLSDTEKQVAGVRARRSAAARRGRYRRKPPGGGQ